MKRGTLTDLNKNKIYPVTTANAVVGNNTDICNTNVKLITKGEFTLIEPDPDTLYLLTKDAPRVVIPNTSYIIPYCLSATTTPELRRNAFTNEGVGVEYDENIIMMFVSETRNQEPCGIRYYDRRTGFFNKNIYIDYQSPKPPGTLGGGPNITPVDICRYENMLLLAGSIGSYGYVVVHDFPESLPIATDMAINSRVDVKSTYFIRIPSVPRFMGMNTDGDLYIVGTNGTMYKTNMSPENYQHISELEIITENLPINGKTISKLYVMGDTIRIAQTQTGKDYDIIDYNLIDGTTTHNNIDFGKIVPGRNYDMDIRYFTLHPDIMIMRGGVNYWEYSDTRGTHVNRLPVIYFDMTNLEIVGYARIFKPMGDDYSCSEVVCMDGDIYRFGSTWGWNSRPSYKMTYSESVSAWSESVQSPLIYDNTRVSLNYYNIYFTLGDYIYAIPYSTLEHVYDHEMWHQRPCRIDIRTLGLDSPASIQYEIIDKKLQDSILSSQNAIKSNGIVYSVNTDCSSEKAYLEMPTFINKIFLDGNGMLTSEPFVIDLYSDRLIINNTYGIPIECDIIGDSYFGSFNWYTFRNSEPNGIIHPDDGIYRFNGGELIKIISASPGTITSPIATMSNGDIIYQEIDISFDSDENEILTGVSRLKKFQVVGGASVLIVDPIPYPDWISSYNRTTLSHSDHFNAISKPDHRKGMSCEYDGTKTYMYADRYIFRANNHFGVGNHSNYNMIQTTPYVRYDSGMKYRNPLMYVYDIVDNKYIKLQEPVYEPYFMNCMHVRLDDTKYAFIGGRPFNRSEDHFGTTKVYDISKDINIINGRSMT